MKLTIKPGKIKGGLSEKKKRMDVDPKQLSMGIEVEMEHTDDKEVAKEIALDHLAEDKNYYTKLKKMEAEKSMDKNEITNEKIQKSLESLYRESFELFKMGRKIQDGSVRQINDLVFEKSGVNWNLVGTALVKASEIAEAPTTIRIFDNKGDTWQRFTVIINNRVYTAGRGILKTVSDMQHGNAVYPNEGLDYQGNLVNITPEGLLVYSRENHLFPIGNELTEVPYGIALAINELVMKSMIDKEEELEKGKKFPDGTVREWKGKKFRKQGGKWVKVSDKKFEGGSRGFMFKDRLVSPKNNSEKTISKALNDLGIDKEYHIAVKDILDKEGLGVDDVKLIFEDSNTGIVVGFENMKFAICTDKQADELATQRLRDVIDNIGVSAFNKDFVMRHIDKDKLSRDLVEREMDAVWDDPDMYLSEDPEGEDGDWTDEQREKAQEIMKERIEDDPLDYVMNMFGEGKGADNFLSKYIDEEALIEDAIKYDGRGHTISGYDGFEHEVSKKGEKSIFYYRVN